MKRWMVRFGWMALGVAALYAMSALAGVASGGSLDPPGPPDSTMKSLEDIRGIWDRYLVANDGDGNGCGSSRFDCVMPKTTCGDQGCFFVFEGARDKETGLVWQRDLDVFAAGYGQPQAAQICLDATFGDRRGWRLPTTAELMTLLTASNGLPTGSPFFDIPLSLFGVSYWTSDTVPGGGGDGFLVVLNSLNKVVWQYPPSTEVYAWCVRGPE